MLVEILGKQFIRRRMLGLENHVKNYVLLAPHYNYINYFAHSTLIMYSMHQLYYWRGACGVCKAGEKGESEREIISYESQCYNSIRYLNL